MWLWSFRENYVKLYVLNTIPLMIAGLQTQAGEFTYRTLGVEVSLS